LWLGDPVHVLNRINFKSGSGILQDGLDRRE